MGKSAWIKLRLFDLTEVIRKEWSGIIKIAETIRVVTGYTKNRGVFFLNVDIQNRADEDTYYK